MAGRVVSHECGPLYRLHVDDDLPLLLAMACAFLGMLVLLAGAPFVIFRWAGRQHEKDLLAWRELARVHALSFQSRPPRVSGVFEGVPLVVGVLVSGPSGQMAMSTRVRGGPPASGPEVDWLRVAPRSLASSFALTSPGPALETGDAAFDARFVTHARDAASARRVLSDVVRAGLVALPRDVTLVGTTGAVALAWRGREPEVPVLEQACRIVAQALR